ncbi:MAG TPA: type VI secretion system amidase effector protein Tae4 [Aridibacter sp.]|nr:type VI secretion system amidase effector protein Tae4 [Aridibacter sp.]
MPKKLPNYEDLAKDYPAGKDAAKVRGDIGGSVDKSWYKNTCIIRVSKSLNSAGHPIPVDSGNFKTRKGADGKWYGLGVQQFWSYMRKTYGKPTVYAEKDAKSLRIPMEKFKGVRGIIGFRVKGWEDASGHFTLWNGFDLVYGGEDHDYFAISYMAALWEAGSTRTTSAEI